MLGWGRIGVGMSTYMAFVTPCLSQKKEQKEGEFRGSRRVGVQLVLRERKECLRKLREQQVASALEEEAVSNWFVSQRYPPPPGHIWTHCRGRTTPGTQVRQARGRPSGQKQDAWWSLGGGGFLCGSGTHGAGGCWGGLPCVTQWGVGGEAGRWVHQTPTATNC